MTACGAASPTASGSSELVTHPALDVSTVVATTPTTIATTEVATTTTVKPGCVANAYETRNATTAGYDVYHCVEAHWTFVGFHEIAPLAAPTTSTTTTTIAADGVSCGEATDGTLKSMLSLLDGVELGVITPDKIAVVPETIDLFTSNIIKHCKENYNLSYSAVIVGLNDQIPLRTVIAGEFALSMIRPLCDAAYDRYPFTPAATDVCTLRS
jgi:hypothetical protein